MTSLFPSLSVHSLSQGDFDGSINDFSKAINLNPDNEMAYHNRGCTYIEKRDYENCIRDFSKVRPAVGEEAWSECAGGGRSSRSVFVARRDRLSTT